MKSLLPLRVPLVRVVGQRGLDRRFTWVSLGSPALKCSMSSTSGNVHVPSNSGAVGLSRGREHRVRSPSRVPSRSSCLSGPVGTSGPKYRSIEPSTVRPELVVGRVSRVVRRVLDQGTCGAVVQRQRPEGRSWRVRGYVQAIGPGAVEAVAVLVLERLNVVGPAPAFVAQKPRVTCRSSSRCTPAARRAGCRSRPPGPPSRWNTQSQRVPGNGLATS